MRLARVVFLHEVPSPRVKSFSRTHWHSVFESSAFMITIEGGAVRIVDRDSGIGYLYPWSNVAAAEPEQAPIEVPLCGTADPSAQTISTAKKRGSG